MLLVAIDTSGRRGSVALCRGDMHSFEVMQLLQLEGGSYSARLMPSIAEMLAQQEISKPQVDAFAVVSGPGSFTGLRVGLATAKALCEVLQKPIIAVSMLEALAELRGPQEGEVITVLDAGRGEVYVGRFQVAAGAAKLTSQVIVKLDTLASELATSPCFVVTPEPKIAEALQVAVVEPLAADEIGRVGLRKLLAGDYADPATLDANYIRRSDAELLSNARRCYPC